MSLAAAAEALGLPEALVERSAAARAAETGVTVDEILAAWAGGGSVPTKEASTGPVEAPAEEPEPTVPPLADEPVPEGDSASTAVGAEATITPSASLIAAKVPTEVTVAEAANLPEVVTVATAGIRERTNFTLPRWLFAVMLIIPVFALFALGGSATGSCGEATELTTNVVTGEIVNCDGSEFTGSGVGGGGPDFITLGEGIYNGTEVSGINCAGCHGANGGGGVGPALNGVITTFGSCADHDEWVRIGSIGFQANGLTTYGDTAKPIAGGMPGHSSLTDEQLSAVSAFERVRFAGGNPDEVLADCGLTIEEPPAPGDGTGETPAEGDQAPGDGEPVPGEADATEAAAE